MGWHVRLLAALHHASMYRIRRNWIFFSHVIIRANGSHPKGVNDMERNVNFLISSNNKKKEKKNETQKLDDRFFLSFKKKKIYIYT